MSDRPHDDMDGRAKPTELPATETGSPPPAGSAEQIGPYHLLEKLGEGGMGEVWLAEQTEPVKRKVALKVIKQGMDTKQVVARFAAEKQALALMDHPAIAKVYDAGATPQGRPYFAMEHVQGVPITEYCDRHRLTNRERLELFMQVCEGVQHAHQKAVIHRDLKPSNVLVAIRDDRPVPKIIDFGVAKATSQKLTDMTLHTQLGMMIGTPAYMSPEQAEMTAEDIDTRTDVYSLGVLLYELLVGALPFDPGELRQAGFDEIRRKIREDEPSKPSTRLSTLGDASTESAKRRRTDLRTLKRQLAGDLDWITMKALEKDRVRRYGSPSELETDIERYLQHQPIVARPPSPAYRARKFIRRHRVGVGASAAALFVLIGFALITAVQARRIAGERDRSERARQELELVVEFQAGMLSDVDAEQMGRGLVTDLRAQLAETVRSRGASEEEVERALVLFNASIDGVNATSTALRRIDRDILDRAGKTIKERFAEQPLIASQLEHTIAGTYRRLGLYERAEPHALRAVEGRQRELGGDHADTLASKFELAWLYGRQGRLGEAELLLRRTLEAQRRVLGDEHFDTLRSMSMLGNLYYHLGRFGESESLQHVALEARRRLLGAEHLDTLRSMSRLANVYGGLGRHEEAGALDREILATRRRVLGADHPETLQSMSNLAEGLTEQGRYDEAEPLRRETLERQRRVLGTKHAETLGSMASLAVIYSKQRRWEDAETLFLQTIEAQRHVLGEEHRDAAWSLSRLASMYADQGRFEEAAALYLKALESQRQVLDAHHPDIGSSLYGLARLSALRSRPGPALEYLRQVLDGGYDHGDRIATDPDLQFLRGDPTFEAIVAEVETRIGEE